MVNPPTTQTPAVYYTPTQLAAAAVLGGWPLADLQTAVAVALAESSGQANVIGPLVAGSRPYGLMQVEYPMHQELFPGGIQSGWWIDGATNFKMARTLYGSQGWRAWETYTTGAYRIYSGQAAAAVAALQGAAGGNLSNAATAALQPTTIRISQAQQAWAAANGGSTAPAAGGVLTTSVGGEGPGSPSTHGPIVGEGVGAPPATSPIVRVLEVLLGSAMLLIGAYKLTQPVTAPIISGAKSAAGAAEKVGETVAPEASAAKKAAGTARKKAAAKKAAAKKAAPAKKAPAKKAAAPAKKAAAKKTTPAKKAAAKPPKEESD